MFYILIDSHCHLIDKMHKKPPEELVRNAKTDGITKIINVGTSIETSNKSIEVAKRFDSVYATVGVYPQEDTELSIKQIKTKLENMLPLSNKIVGIGECGIDIQKSNRRDIDSQIELFEAQIEIAIEHSLPIMLHNRNGDEQILQTLNNFSDKNVFGVAHCFVSNWNIAKKLLDANFYISFSGIITYTSGSNLIETVRNVPLNKFVVETDAPCLAPQTVRDKVNEPRYVKITAQKIAEIKKISFDEVCKHSYKNTCDLFKIC